jgi:hypothetical protein
MPYASFMAYAEGCQLNEQVNLDSRIHNSYQVNSPLFDFQKLVSVIQISGSITSLVFSTHSRINSISLAEPLNLRIEVASIRTHSVNL